MSAVTDPSELTGALISVVNAGDLALTNTRSGATATAEVARRQADGSWRWLIDRPDVMGRRAVHGGD